MNNQGYPSRLIKILVISKHSSGKLSREKLNEESKMHWLKEMILQLWSEAIRKGMFFTSSRI
tara:strand:+ start:23 stop:208 length:186 start_codon:yes stop_codon:yes gene_type:complete